MSVYHEVPTEVITPRRIQRRRSKGWRMPEGAVYVGRPSRWGNPFRALSYPQAHAAGLGDQSVVMGTFHDGRKNRRAAEEVVDLYRRWVTSSVQCWMTGCRPRGPLVPVRQGPTWNRAWVQPSEWWAEYRAPFTVDDIRAALAGRDLACWCPLDQPCHADVLLEIANGGAAR